MCFSQKNGRRRGSVCASFRLTFCSSFFYLQCLENYRESKLKVFPLFRTFLRLSYDKASYFSNVFDAQTFLSSSYFWLYKFTSENVLP